jgi:hypothetical protein
MRSVLLKILLPLLLLTACSGPGKISKTTDATVDNLKKHIQYLADDKLEGRRTGTKGEELAMGYIISQFKNIGLQPKGTEYYPQAFEVNDGKYIDSATHFSINGKSLTPGKDFFPFPFSANNKMQFNTSLEAAGNDDPWFFDLKKPLEENKNNPHFDLMEYIRTNSKKAADRGGDVIILYNSSEIDDKLAFNGKDKSETLTIPVLYVSKETAAKYFITEGPAPPLQLTIHVDIGEKKRIGHNVIGYIDNKAATTVILGAHYDHLGYGEDGNSRNTGHEPAIHNGADDNASGTAALIELARKLKTSKAKNNNFLFIAFSGEELGLFGSKYFTEHPTVDLKAVNYMINMDMVGRLNDSARSLTIGGYGTSPTWGPLFSNNFINVKKTPPLFSSFRFDSSGTGPSDHTSFYRKDIPVLFYFTGLHTDYHKPSDDADKINYEGEKNIISHILHVIELLDKEPKLAFAKTKETPTTTTARFSVSMGIMPDYTYAGTGVRVDGVSEGKPAQKAGLKAGDIVLQIGEYTTSSLESYMQTLGKFKKGDKVKVKYKRGNEVLETTVEF